MQKKFSEEPPVQVYLNKNEKISDVIFLVILIMLFIYTIFLPLQLGTAWLYSGLSIFLLGVIIYLSTVAPWANTPIAQPITTGIYRYSRHPMYLSIFVQLIGIGTASASWIFLLVTIALIALSNIAIDPEERGCIEKYGSAYREYMDRTPRRIGMPKSH